MKEQEIIKILKKLLPSLFGEEFQASEKEDSCEWNFNSGLYMCSIVFVGNKYELKINKVSFCGTVETFNEAEIIEKIKENFYRPELKFLEKFLGESNPDKLWNENGGEKFKLELDGDKLGWSMSCKNGKKFIYLNGLCKELKN